jgi:threonine dehydratase
VISPAPRVIDVFQARARIRTRVLHTPLLRSEWLSAIAGRAVFLKLESLQPTGSFKIRGALNAAIGHVERHGAAAPPIVTASAGNHGRGLAYAAEALGLSLTVYVPRDAPRAKQEAIGRHGADLRPVSDYDEAERAARRHASNGEAVFISPYAHEDVIAGAGTIALEIFEDLPDVETIVAPVGGGGLASGIGIVARAVRAPSEAPERTPQAPRPRVIGVEASASTAFTTSLAAGRITAIVPRPTLADGLAGNLDPESPTFEIVRSTVARVVTVTEEELAGALRGLAEREHLIAEAAGAAAVAAIQSGKVTAERGPLVAIVSGANIDLERLLVCLAAP